MTLPASAIPLYGKQSTVAEQPPATHLPDGVRWIQTDGVEQYVDGGAWVDVPSGGGGGGIAAWGQVSTAEYSGSGSPVGVVTPDASGDLYLDATTPALWQANGVTNTDWQLVSGSSGISAWGQVSTAQYSGAGTPVGTVTPDAEGDLYVDTTTPALWQATGVTDTDWQQIGTGSAAVSVANFGGNLQSSYNPGGTVLDALGPTLTTPVDPVAFQYGAVNIPVSLPLFTYPPGAIATFGGWNVNQVDTTNDPYDIRVALIISDATGTNSLVLQGAATANAGTPGDAATINPGDLTVTNLVGTDLSYDTGTGEITSAAGGVYWIQAIWNGDWD